MLNQAVAGTIESLFHYKATAKLATCEDTRLRLGEELRQSIANSLTQV